MNEETVKITHSIRNVLMIKYFLLLGLSLNLLITYRHNFNLGIESMERTEESDLTLDPTSRGRYLCQATLRAELIVLRQLSAFLG